MGYFRFHLPLVVGLILALAVLPLTCQTLQKNELSKNAVGRENAVPRDDGFFRLFPEQSVILNIPLQAIRHAAKPIAIPPAPSANHRGTSRRFASEQLNSRSSAEISSGELSVAWQSEIPRSFEPVAVMELNGTALVEANGFWLLFDRNGKKLAQRRTSSSGVFLDNENFYYSNAAGLIFGQRLNDANASFAFSLLFGNQYARSYMFRSGRRMIVVSRERELDPHKPNNKERSLVELVDLGDPLVTDRDGVLTSAKPIEHFARNTDTFLAASTGDKLVLATQDRIYTTDLSLRFLQALSGEFVPLSLSLDESGRIYALVEKSGSRFLWTISTAGEIVSEYELPAGFRQTKMPPAIGFDHTVFLSAADEIISIDSRGKLAWRVKLEANLGGFVVTPKRTLLVTSGRDLLLFDPKGNPRTLFSFQGEDLVTAPTITDDGSVLVASRNRLIKLVAARAP